MMADLLPAIRDYHVFINMVYGLSPEEMLRTEKMKVSPTNMKEEVMVVYKT